MKKLPLLMVALLIVVLGATQVGAQTDFTLLHNFAGGNDDGEYPYGSLIYDGTSNSIEFIVEKL